MRILVFGFTDNIGGIETSFMQYYRHLDKKIYHFDFVTMYNEMVFSDEIRKNGSEIFRVANIKKHPLLYKKEVNKIIKNNNYDCVYVNMLSAANILPLKIAKKNKVKNIIAHSHTSSFPKNSLKTILHRINKNKIKRLTTVRVACSQKSGDWLFGKRSNYEVLENIIDEESFKYDEALSGQFRKNDTDYIVGHVGRCCNEKNQDFILNIAKKIQNEDKTVKFVLIGDGPDFDRIKKRVLNESINNIEICGRKERINQCYSGFDAFILPSRFEGLPMAGIEAQVNGLPCIFSNTITKDLERTNNCSFLELDEDCWVETIKNKPQRNKDVQCRKKDCLSVQECYRKMMGFLQYEIDKIDFVVTWVDDSDLGWRRKKNEYLTKESGTPSEWASSTIRYRDWGTLKYWFRSIEKNAPWVNKVFFVTCGQKPEWLNEKCEKLVLVNHEDFMPKSYLPTFNSNAIELNLFRIKGLSENYVYFNDDMFINAPVSKKDVFRNGKPVLETGFDVARTDYGINNADINNAKIYNKYFSKRIVIRNNWRRFFAPRNGKYLIKTIALLPWPSITGIAESHNPSPYSKKTFEKIWNLEPEILDRTSRNRFRQNDDVNHWLAKGWHMLSGDSYVQRLNFSKSYTNKETHRIVKDLKKRQHRFICLNDYECADDEFQEKREEIIKAFDDRYPEKSSFEV